MGTEIWIIIGTVGAGSETLVLVGRSLCWCGEVGAGGEKLVLVGN